MINAYACVLNTTRELNCSHVILLANNIYIKVAGVVANTG